MLLLPPLLPPLFLPPGLGLGFALGWILRGRTDLGGTRSLPGARR